MDADAHEGKFFDYGGRVETTVPATDDSLSEEAQTASSYDQVPVEGPGASAAARVGIFNVKYSPNLGDGIIAECLETALGHAKVPIEARSIDLAGRSEFSPANGSGRQALLALVHALPGFLRSIALPVALKLLVRFRLTSKWDKALQDCDAVVIGGGALLADADRNFPTKLSGALKLCAQRGLPVFFASVGVTPGWSRAGRHDFLNAAGRSNVVAGTVRDRASIQHWKREFGDALPAPRLALDPGLLCALTYPAPEPFTTNSEQGDFRIGIGLTNPLVLSLHGCGDFDSNGHKAWLRGWIAEAASCGAVSLFTNGSPEDEEFADEVAGWFAANERIERSPRFHRPSDLAQFIASLDLVASHRLHACIAAYSYRTPMIGFAWDRKVDSFFDLAGRSDYLVRPGDAASASASILITQAISDPPDVSNHHKLLQQCRDEIAVLARQLAATTEVLT